MGIRYIIRIHKLKRTIKTIKRYTHKLKRTIKTIKRYFPGNLEHDRQRKEYRFTWTESLERELWGGKR